DQRQWCHTDRTAGTMYQPDLLRQQFVDAKADDGMGLSTTDLHDGPRAGGDAVDVLGVVPGCVGISLFIDVFHVLLRNQKIHRKACPELAEENAKAREKPKAKKLFFLLFALWAQRAPPLR